MAGDEFSLIEEYFAAIGTRSQHTQLGIGDDAAVCSIPEGCQLVSSMDTLISGVHFPADTAPADIAHKALAVNLSDLAAMAAEPAWFLMSLTLPEIDDKWIREFATALNRIAENYAIELVGGDTCRGPLSITIQVTGFVPEDTQVTRAGAKPGDSILVSGRLGDAALGLASLQERVDLPVAYRETCVERLVRPLPRLELIPFLRRYASAAIDISDGLLADLGHLVSASGCGANIRQDTLPVDHWVRQNNAFPFALNEGDDYEICCCVPEQHLAQIESWNRDHPDCPLTVIGEITESEYYLVRDGQKVDVNEPQGYRHFG